MSDGGEGAEGNCPQTGLASLVGVAAAACLGPTAGQTNYGGAKAALANIGTTLAAELKRYGVTTNVICPSGLTRMTEDLRPDFGSDELEEIKAGQAIAHRTNEYVANSPNNGATNVKWQEKEAGANTRCYTS